MSAYKVHTYLFIFDKNGFYLGSNQKLKVKRSKTPKQTENLIINFTQSIGFVFHKIDFRFLHISLSIYYGRPCLGRKPEYFRGQIIVKQGNSFLTVYKYSLSFLVFIFSSSLLEYLLLLNKDIRSRYLPQNTTKQGCLEDHLITG